MSFLDDFNSCMSSNGLPTPGQVFDSLSDALEFLHQLHTAWESAGGNEEMTLGALVALGAATGIDEAVLAALGEAAEITVLAYAAACLACVVSVAGSSIWNSIATTNDPWLHNQLVAQADQQNIANPSAMA
jgi:hypothetical protein